MGSRPWAFQRAIDGVRVSPLSPPKGGSKSDFLFSFLNKIQLQSNKVCYKVPLREKFQRQSCRPSINIPHLTVHRY